MDNLLVVKIKHNGTLRRINVPKDPKPSFEALDNKIRELFKLSTSAPLDVTYVDNEGDTVTMGDDLDLYDAWAIQLLNPLKLTVNCGKDEPTSFAESKATESKHAGKPAALKADCNEMKKVVKRIEEQIKKAFQGGSSNLNMQQVAAMYEPFLKVAPGKIAEVVAAAVNGGLNVSFEPIFEDGFGTPAPAPAPAPAPVSAPFAEKTAENSTSSFMNEQDPFSGLASEEKKPSETPASASAPSVPVSGDVDRVFHSGVQCDVCGQCPIVGPRYKSIVKHDYDLCRGCYEKEGNEKEFSKIERPLFRPRHHPWFHGAGGPAGAFHGRGFHGPAPGGNRPFANAPYVPPPFFGGRPFHMGRGGSCSRAAAEPRSYDGKLDARFVLDVSIFDGTEMAPLTHFTKIWKLRNSGTAPWPQGTQLVHVGGDKLGASDNVNLELPENGIAPGQEVEASVDLVAPEAPGRYVSHWRLLAPGGPKFGHRVWALIQVVPKGEPSPQEAQSLAESLSSATLEAAATPAADEAPELDAIDADVSIPEETEEVATFVPPVGPFSVNPQAEPAPEEAVEEVISAEVSERVDIEPSAAFTAQSGVNTEAKAQASAPNSPKTENTSVGGFSLVDMPDGSVGGIVSAPLEAASVASEETQTEKESVDDIVNIAEETPKIEKATQAVVERNEGPVDSFVMATKLDAKIEEEDGENNEMFVMLKQLASMGFTDSVTNEDLLAENKMDLQKTIDDLVAASEWDHMLEELEEMGFADAATNRRIMLKNKGSVKRTVKELVKIYMAK